MRVVLLESKHCDCLFQFETDNKTYFDSIGLGRNADYYERKNFDLNFRELFAEQENGTCFMHLIFSSDDELVGRVNLVDVIRGPFNKAELGYRVGKIHQGKGYATQAVELVLKMAIEVYDLHRIEAGTGKSNTGSQRVLQKNKFRYVGCYEKYMLCNHEWTDSLLYEKILDV